MSHTNKIIIVLEGGAIQGVLCDDLAADILIVDYDTEGQDPEDYPGLVAVVDKANDRTHILSVGGEVPSCIKTIAWEAREAIQKSQVEGWVKVTSGG